MSMSALVLATTLAALQLCGAPTRLSLEPLPDRVYVRIMLTIGMILGLIYWLFGSTGLWWLAGTLGTLMGLGLVLVIAQDAFWRRISR